MDRWCRKKLKSALRWRLTKAEAASFLEEAAAADPGDRALVAEAARLASERIDPRPDLMLFWRAFFDLTHDRGYAAMGGPLPISFGSIDRWARRYGVEGGLFDDLKNFIRELDAEYLAVMNELARRRGKER